MSRFIAILDKQFTLLFDCTLYHKKLCYRWFHKRNNEKTNTLGHSMFLCEGSLLHNLLCLRYCLALHSTSSYKMRRTHQPTLLLLYFLIVLYIIESCVTVDFTNVIMGRRTRLVIPFSYVRVHYYTIFVTISVIVWLSTQPVAIKCGRPINPVPAWTVPEIPL